MTLRGECGGKGGREAGQRARAVLGKGGASGNQERDALVLAERKDGALVNLLRDGALADGAVVGVDVRRRRLLVEGLGRARAGGRGGARAGVERRHDGDVVVVLVVLVVVLVVLERHGW